MEQPLNMDRQQRCVIETASMGWEASPMAGVWRKKLERQAAESGQVTSVVRYEPGMYFRAHTHPLGEEILVLDGVFSDEQGDCPAGTYLRNPPGSSHAPFSEPGCVIFVKLNQFAADDLARVRIDSTALDWRPGLVDGLAVLPLHSYLTEHTALVRWAPGTVFHPHVHPGGEEIFVVSGTFADESGEYPQGTWMRSPSYSKHHPFSEEGCTLLVKTGHLGQDGQ